METTALKSRMSSRLARQTEPAVNVAMENIALAPAKSGYVALTENALEIIYENLKNQPLSFALFDIIKSPSGGATVFTVPGLSGEGTEKELIGIILDYTTPRAYWDTPDPVKGMPPVCFSRDSMISHDGKSCARCRFNDFGSKDGGETNAKAYKESVAIFLLR